MFNLIEIILLIINLIKIIETTITTQVKLIQIQIQKLSSRLDHYRLIINLKIVCLSTIVYRHRLL